MTPAATWFSQARTSLLTSTIHVKRMITKHPHINLFTRLNFIKYQSSILEVSQWICNHCRTLLWIAVADQHQDWYLMLHHTKVKYKLVSLNNGISWYAHFSRPISLKHVGSSLIDNKVRLELHKRLLNLSDLLEIDLICVVFVQEQALLDSLHGIVVMRLHVWQVGVNYEHLRVMHEVSSISVSLKSIKIYNHDLLCVVVSSKMMDCYLNVRVDRSMFSIVPWCMCVAPTYIDCPSNFLCHFCSHDCALCHLKHRLKEFHSDQPCWSPCNLVAKESSEVNSIV